MGIAEFLITAIVFTVVGFFFSRKYHTERAVSQTINMLIKNKFIKTSGHGEDRVMIKYTDNQ